MGTWSVWHWVVVLVVLVLLFGSKRLPDAARGLGRSLRILKSEVRQMNAEGDSDSHEAESSERAAKPAAPTQAPAAEPAGSAGGTPTAAPPTRELAAAPQQQANEQVSHATTV